MKVIIRGLSVLLLAALVNVQPLAARGETPAAFGRHCIPSGCVAPRSNTPGILARRALPAGRIVALGATLDFHHGLLAFERGKLPAHEPRVVESCRNLSW